MILAMSILNSSLDSSSIQSSNQESQSINIANTSTPQRLWSCLYCGSKFDSKMKLKNHGVEVTRIIHCIYSTFFVNVYNSTITFN